MSPRRQSPTLVRSRLEVVHLPTVLKAGYFVVVEIQIPSIAIDPLLSRAKLCHGAIDSFRLTPRQAHLFGGHSQHDFFL